MIFFTTDTENSDPSICEGIPRKHRQKYMRELKVVEVLVDILHYPFANNLFDLDLIRQGMPVTKVCVLC